MRDPKWKFWLSKVLLQWRLHITHALILILKYILYITALFICIFRRTFWITGFHYQWYLCTKQYSWNPSLGKWELFTNSSWPLARLLLKVKHCFNFIFIHMSLNANMCVFAILSKHAIQSHLVTGTSLKACSSLTWPPVPSDSQYLCTDLRNVCTVDCEWCVEFGYTFHCLCIVAVIFVSRFYTIAIRYFVQEINEFIMNVLVSFACSFKKK